ncbi:MAG: DNA internalization-related competence protein ComEC/Rec2 [Burkholderiaceae bacterium]
MTGRLSLMAVVLATGAVQCFAAMPGSPVLVGVAVVAIAVSLLTLRLKARGSLRVLIPCWALFLGLLMTIARVEHRLADALIDENQNRVARVVLRVASLVTIRSDSRQFEAEVISSRPAGVPSRIQVTWAAAGRSGPYGRFGQPDASFPELIPGQVWRMALTLKRPHGARNPHAFDYEAYMFANNLRATGSVRGAPKLLADQPWASLSIVAQRARHRVREAMQPYLRDKRYGAVLLALAIGDQASVESGDWQVFNRTGITHLVSISGSHITMIAALGGIVTLWGWRRLQFRSRALAERLPAQVAAAVVALWIAWFYCLLAGWGVPARRTFLMLTVVALAHIARLPMNASRLLSLVAFAVVVLDPWALMASGFWLSFGAVYVLMASPGWVGQRLGRESSTTRQRVGRFLGAASRLQLAITVGLMPLLALIFHQISVASPLANAYAIPVISLVVTPLSLLLAAVSFVPGLEWLATIFAWLGHVALYAIMIPTVWLSELGPASFDIPAAPLWLTVIALLGLALAVAPYGFPLRNAAWLLMLPALFWRPERPLAGDWTMTALDVGQSSAVVIQTAHHSLLFDTGLRSSPTSDQGARTIGPFMRASGIKKLDVMVVSHADIDHAGGVRSTLATTPVEQSFSSFDLLSYLHRESRLLGESIDSARIPLAMSACKAGVAWQVDGVGFEFLWPLDSTRFIKNNRRNDHACVLRVHGHHHSVLLTSDIGVLQEASLLDRGLGAADVVLAAHHGSKNSSGADFVARVQAAHVVAQVGAWNRYGHPNPLIEQRWERAGAVFWRTDRDGSVKFSSSLGGLQVEGARASSRRYWQGR